MPFGRPKTVAGAPAKEEETKAGRLRSGKQPGLEGKQQTLDEKVTKTVTFAKEEQQKDKEIDIKNKDFRNMVLEELGKIRQESVELDKLKLEIKTREVEMFKRLEKIEKKMESWEERERERIDRLDAIEGRIRFICSEVDGGTGSTSSIASGRTTASAFSARTDGARSGVSRNSSVSLSEREVIKMKRMVSEQERKERLENIVIKGVPLNTVDRLDTKKWAQDFIRNKVGVEVGVVNARINGRVVVVKVGSLEQKNEIMQNKSKLAGTNVFIEYDLSFDERQVQGEIHRWVKQRRESGLNVKSGNGRVCVNGIWARWEEVGKITKLVEEAERKRDETEAARKAVKEGALEVAEKCTSEQHSDAVGLDTAGPSNSQVLE